MQVVAMVLYAEKEFEPGLDVASDEDLLAYAWMRGSTSDHPSGTCRMGVDEKAVVGPDLKVKGLTGIPTADGSIMPRLVSGSTNAPIIMIGEKACYLILAQLPPALAYVVNI